MENNMFRVDIDCGRCDVRHRQHGKRELRGARAFSDLEEKKHRMCIPRIKSDLHGHVDELFSADLLQSSDAENQAALKSFLSSTYSSLASLSWHLGADGDVLQREARPAAELVDDVFFTLNREREFSGANCECTQGLLGTLNSRQQFGGPL
jgi:hypothetical protein